MARAIRAGICIPDFEHRPVLQLTGQVRNRTGAGAGHWEFEVSCWILRDMPRTLAWDSVDAALPDTGVVTSGAPPAGPEDSRARARSGYSVPPR